MAAPVISLTYPADNDTGIPVGAIGYIQFDRGIDLYTAKNSVILVGPDYDTMSGPDNAMWIDSDRNTNPFFLRSPGFQGITETTLSLVYWDLDSDAEVDPGTITGEADETGYGVGGVGHRLYITPAYQLAPEHTYKLYILGDPDTTGNGISSRTVFDVEPDGGNSGTTGTVVTYGGYTGTTTDTLNVRITLAGDIGTAQYKYWYTSDGEGAAVTGKVTNRRFRTLVDGIQIQFTGSGFEVGDLYSCNLEPATRLATSTTVTFTTNDGTFTAAPDSPSTPATAQPPATVLPPLGPSSDDYLYVVEMDPQNGEYNVNVNKRTITITFSSTLDASTITQSTVKLWKHDVAGYYDDTSAPVELQKKLTVSGDTLTIEF